MIHVLACNIAEDTQFFNAGTPAYIVGVSPKEAKEKRVRVFGCSRSGRYIPIWLPYKRVIDIRPETMTEQTPIYGELQKLLRGRDAICDLSRSLIIIYAFCHILGLPLPKVPEYAKVNYERAFLDRAS
jgi:hypothetical protein